MGGFRGWSEGIQKTLIVGKIEEKGGIVRDIDCVGDAQ